MESVLNPSARGSSPCLCSAHVLSCASLWSCSFASNLAPPNPASVFCYLIFPFRRPSFASLRTNTLQKDPQVDKNYNTLATRNGMQDSHEKENAQTDLGSEIHLLVLKLVARTNFKRNLSLSESDGLRFLLKFHSGKPRENPQPDQG